MHRNKTLYALGVILHALDVQNSTEKHCFCTQRTQEKNNILLFFIVGLRKNLDFLAQTHLEISL